MKTLAIIAVLLLLLFAFAINNDADYVTPYEPFHSYGCKPNSLSYQPMPIDKHDTYGKYQNIDANVNPIYEKVIFDKETGSVMTGKEFMAKTGIIAPPWISPAWTTNKSKTGGINSKDYENDPRMLYNKCSLACCGDQYPLPFELEKDPFVCDENGDKKYLSSNYTCNNNVGGNGCLCITPKQAEGLSNGFIDY